MKALIIALALLISSSAYAQETIKVIGLKNTDAEAVASTLKNVVETVDKDKDDKKRPSTEQMAESMFKRIDVDKNGSLSLKEFKAFYAKIRSRGRSSSGSQRSSRRDGPSRPQGGPQRGPQRDGGRDRKKDK
tara:strand:+ start:215 stop:610 length:396 start_codon:yes stop_codon:yes gene_type:complete